MLSARSSEALHSSQVRFLETLEPRILALEAELDALAASKESPETRARLRRRLEAMADTAQALDLAAISSAFSSAESCLANLGDDATADQLDPVRQCLLTVPSLVPPAVAQRRDQTASHAAGNAGEAARLFEEAWAASSVATAASARAVPAVAAAGDEPAPTFRVPRPGPESQPTRGASGRGARGEGDAIHLREARVLIADPDAEVRRRVAALLRETGAHVIEASSGAAALAAALDTAAPPDLVLCDLQLDTPDGFGLCRNLGRDVATRDVPVVLLADSADLLRRADELGAGATAYLRKGVKPEVLIRCAAEALQSRTGLCARLAREEVTMGRLDGLTATLVLRLVVEHTTAARTTLRDAALEYEVVTEHGGVVSVARHTTEGTRTRPDDVLPGLLGMRSGQFCVERLEAAGARTTPLQELLAPPIERIRRAVSQVQGSNLGAIACLVLDPAAVEPYLSASPPVVARLLSKLQQGVAPAALLQSVSAGLLESVLVDLASRGAVLGAADANGHELLSDAPGARFDVLVKTPTGGLQAVAQSRPPEAPAAPRHAVAPEERTTLRPLAPSASAIEQEDAADTPFLPRAADSAPADFPLPAPPAMDQSADLSAFVLQRLGETPEPLGTVAFRPTRSRRANQRRGVAASAAPLKARPSAAPATTDASVPASAGPHAQRSPQLASADAGDPPSLFDPDLAATASDPPPQVASRGRTAEPESGAAAPSWLAHARDTLAAAAPRRARRAARAGSLRALFTSETWFDASGAPPPVSAAPDHEEAPPPSEPLQAPDAPEPLASHAPHNSPEDADPFWGGDDPTDHDGGLSGEPPQLQPQTTAPAVRPRASKRPRGALLPHPAKLAALARAAAAPLCIMGLTAAGAYWGITQVTDKVELATAPPTGAVDDTEAQTESQALHPAAAGPARNLLAPPGAATPGAQAALEGPKMMPQAMPLPAGLELDPSKGLLEINTGDTHRILVDKVFVGRGPVRRIPLAPGDHSVVLRSGATESSFTVSITAGRRTRLQPQAQATN